MTRLTQFFLLLILVAAVSLSSCKSDDDIDNGACAANFNFALELQAESTALSNAASAYANDPTTANCEAYRSAFTSYLDAAADIDNCVPTADRSAYLQSITEAQAEVDALVC